MGAEPPSYPIVSCQNWKVLISWRYDFWDIVDTISELAKAEKGYLEDFQGRTDSVRQPDIVRQAEWKGSDKMSQDLKLIRKQFRVTKQEDRLLKEMMKEQGSETFSDFLRQNLLQKDRQEDNLVTWFSLWQSHKLEEISRDIHQVTVLAEEHKQVTTEHLRIILTCVQELISELDKQMRLSSDFQDKYMGGR